MGAPNSGMEAAEQPAAETLLTAFRTIDPAERRRHASVLNYWLSIRGNKEFPPLHDFNPLEISDFGPSSVLLELIGGGHDAEVRHLGDALQGDGTFERIIDAPNPSVLACISRKLPIVAISRDFLAFEDDLSTDGSARCWVTLLPLSSSGSWVDYVYAFVSVEAARDEAAEAVEPPVEDVAVEEAEEVAEAAAEAPEPAVESVPVEVELPAETHDEAVEPLEAVIDEQEPADAPARPGFAKLLEGFAGLAGFYGQGVKVDPVIQTDPAANGPPEPEGSEAPAVEPSAVEPAAVEPPAEEPTAAEAMANEQLTDEPPADEPAAVEAVVAEEPTDELPATEPLAMELTEQPAPATEGTLQSKLSEVRAMADEARAAKLKANMALYEGLGAAYDFALDAEDSPEEYLRLVEAQGMKIQLRAPMAPVVKLAFDGLCDDSIIKQLEAVLAWALKQELPRGTLAARIEEAGGIAGILNGAPQPS